MFKNKLILILAFFSFIVTFYKSTWLPGNKLFVGTSFYMMEFPSILLFLFFIDFSVLNMRIRLFYKENKYFFLLTIVFLISSFVFNSHEFSSVYFISFYLAYIFNFLIFFIALPLFIINNPEYLNKLLFFITLFSLVFCVIGLLLLFLGITTEVRFDGMVTSVMVHPNFVPAVALVGIFSNVTIIYAGQAKPQYKKLFFIGTLLIQFLALALSFTRDGMMALISGAAVFYFLTRTRTFLYTLPFTIPTVTIFLIEFIKLKGFVSFLSRFYLLVPAYYLLIADKTRLLWGYGAQNATDIYVKYKIMYNVFEDVNSPHNSIISYILMYGLIFTAMFLFIIFIVLFKGIRTVLKEKDPNVKVILASFISICISYLVVNQFESHLAMAHLTMMHPFLIFFGLLFFSLRNKSFFENFKVRPANE